jgi:hypothetical protein
VTIACVHEGPGPDAMPAWEAFRAVAVEPAFDPIKAWGDFQQVRSAGFLFEALFSQGWPARHGSRGAPDHYALMFTRQFYVGDAGDMLGLTLSVVVAAADELRGLRGELHGEVADDWIAQVEASPAFTVPMTRHEALRFTFGVDSVG